MERKQELGSYLELTGFENLNLRKSKSQSDIIILELLGLVLTIPDNVGLSGEQL